MAKKAAAKKAPARAKKAPDGRLATTAVTVGRTLGRAARKIDKVTAAVKKAAAFKRAPKKKRKDPAAAAKRARQRETWKAREREAAAQELAQQGALVDERARVRAATGRSWSNRKPR